MAVPPRIAVTAYSVSTPKSGCGWFTVTLRLAGVLPAGKIRCYCRPAPAGSLNLLSTATGCLRRVQHRDGPRAPRRYRRVPADRLAELESAWWLSPMAGDSVDGLLWLVQG